MKRKYLFTLTTLPAVIIGSFLLLGMSSTKAEGGGQSEAGSHVDYRKRIAKVEKIVAKDPKNFSQWVQLGNDYFDSGQPEKAVNAYDKALKLNPNDTDVLIDQGVCYKKIGRYDRAVANFEKVLKIDPNNDQSLVDLGIVYAVDLEQPDKALKAWNRFLEINQTSPAAQQVRLWAEQLKSKGRLDSCADK